jgi:hypothetical protein
VQISKQLADIGGVQRDEGVPVESRRRGSGAGADRGKSHEGDCTTSICDRHQAAERKIKQLALIF